MGLSVIYRKVKVTTKRSIINYYFLLLHHQHRQCAPPSKGMTALAGACVLIVILPDEPRFGVLLEHIVHYVRLQLTDDLVSSGLVRASFGGVVLESPNDQVVDVDLCIEFRK